MLVTLLVTSFLAASCSTTPAQKAEKLPTADPFPMPTEGLSIKAGADGDVKLDVLLNEFSRVTGQNLLITPETLQMLKRSGTGLNRSVDVPPQEVYMHVESILLNQDFMFSILSDREPRLLGVSSLNQAGGQRGGGIKNYSTFVPGKEIAAWARHPAFLVTTTIDLPHTDVRTLSNSMRTMFTDAQTQQIIPVGNSNSLILTGFGPQIASLVRTLYAIDDAARMDMEKQAKAEKSAPKEPVAK